MAISCPGLWARHRSRRRCDKAVILGLPGHGLAINMIEC
jgi:hypothetical protein